MGGCPGSNLDMIGAHPARVWDCEWQPQVKKLLLGEVRELQISFEKGS